MASLGHIIYIQMYLIPQNLSLYSLSESYYSKVKTELVYMICDVSYIISGVYLGGFYGSSMQLLEIECLISAMSLIQEVLKN